MFEVAGRLRGICFSVEQLRSNTEEFMKLADGNSDGMISYSEFRMAIQNRPELIVEFFNAIGACFPSRNPLQQSNVHSNSYNAHSFNSLTNIQNNRNYNSYNSSNSNNNLYY